MGYVPVYIVSGPADMQGQVKILQYGKQFKDFFDNHIFGIKKQNKNEETTDIEDESIGVEAFMFYDEENAKLATRGYNLIIRTSSKKMSINGRDVNMPQYSLEFSRKPTEIDEIDGIDLASNAGIKYFLTLNKTLKYDEEFYLKSTDEELQEFKLHYIAAESVNDTPTSKVTVNTKTKEVEEEEDTEKDEIPMHFDSDDQAASDD